MMENKQNYFVNSEIKDIEVNKLMINKFSNKYGRYGNKTEFNMRFSWRHEKIFIGGSFIARLLTNNMVDHHVY